MASPPSTIARLQGALDRLSQAALGDSLLQQLGAPVALACAPGALPALHTLPLTQQADVLLLVRAAPHKFPQHSLAVLLAGPLSGSAPGPHLGAGLLQQLAEGLQGVPADPGSVQWDGAPAVGPCPDFLFTPAPVFPWAPRLLQGVAAPPKAQAGPAAAAAARAAAGAAAAVAPALLEAQPAAPAKIEGDGRKRPGCSEDAVAAADVVAGAAAAKRQRVGPTTSSEEEDEEEGGTAKESRAPEGVDKRAAVQQPTATPAADMAAAAAEAPAAAAAAALRRALDALPPGEPLGAEAKEALDSVLSAAGAAGAAGPALLAQAGVQEGLADDMLLLVLREAVGPTSTFARCSLVAEGLLLCALRALGGPPSRALGAAVEHLGTVNPQALLQSCFRPLLASPGFNQHQAELLTRAAKDWLPASLLPELLLEACGAGGGAVATAAAVAGSHWNEQLVGLVQAVLGAKPELPQAALQALAQALQGAAGAEPLHRSVKFAKLMMTAVKQYGGRLAGSKAQLQAAAAATQTFMTKSVLAAVAKL